MDNQTFGRGQGKHRLEDARFLTGQGHFGDDRLPAEALHAAFVRPPVAHADILSIDIEQALAMPGVIAVYTGADWQASGYGDMPLRTHLKNADGTPMAATPYPALASVRVRHPGECVAMVVATSRVAAQDAAESVFVDYEDLPAVSNMRVAIRPGTQIIHDGATDNIAFTWEDGDRQAVEEAFASAAKIVRLDFVNPRVCPTPMEPRTLTASPQDDGGFVLEGGVQNVFAFRDLLTDEVFHWPRDKLRVRVNDIGGSFGARNQIQPEHALCLFAAEKTGRPVHWAAERGEDFIGESRGRDHLSEAELALDAEGEFLALRVSTLAGLGAYISTNGAYVPTFATAVVMGGAYKIPAIHMQVRGVLTNTGPVDAYRGAGRPEAIYLIERLIDVAAEDLGLDRIELRRKNLIAVEDIPYRTAHGKTVDSGHFGKVLEQGLARADMAGFSARLSASGQSGRGLRGFGVAFYMEATLGRNDEVTIAGFGADGTLHVTTGTQSTGQGHETAWLQLLATRLQVPVDEMNYEFHQADTGLLPLGGGHGGSRSLHMGGSALTLAADKVIEKGQRLAGHLLEAAVEDIVFEVGRFTVAGTDRHVGWPQIITAAYDGRAEAIGLEVGLIEEGKYDHQNHTFPYGCHCAEVEVDPDTGLIRLVKYTVTDDFGHILNPALVMGQIMGGVAQGLGQAAIERIAYDVVTGQLLTGSFMDYAMPRADDLPMIDIDFYEGAPSPSNPLGIKGCGEAGAIAATPAVVNAVVDALKGFGIRHIDMPLTPETVWRAIRDA